MGHGRPHTQKSSSCRSEEMIVVVVVVAAVVFSFQGRAVSHPIVPMRSSQYTFYVGHKDTV